LWTMWLSTLLRLYWCCHHCCRRPFLASLSTNHTLVALSSQQW
jgi:hypothetical protein